MGFKTINGKVVNITEKPSVDSVEKDDRFDVKKKPASD